MDWSIQQRGIQSPPVIVTFVTAPGGVVSSGAKSPCSALTVISLESNSVYHQDRRVRRELAP